jgi:hypothetical protein
MKAKWMCDDSSLRGATWPLNHFLCETVRPLFNAISSKASLNYYLERQVSEVPLPTFVVLDGNVDEEERVHLLSLSEKCVQRRECASRPGSSTCTDKGDEVGRGTEFVVICSFRKWSPAKEPGERAPAKKHMVLRRKDSESLEP